MRRWLKFGIGHFRLSITCTIFTGYCFIKLNLLIVLMIRYEYKNNPTIVEN